MIITGDALTVLRTLPNESVNCCISSPPYFGLRDYQTGKWEGGDPSCDHLNSHGTQGKTGQRADRTFTGAQNYYREKCRKCGATRIDQQVGLERTPEEYVARLVEIFSHVRRVLRSDGTVWCNLGDSFANDGKWGGQTGGKHANGLHGEPVGRGKRTTGLKPKDLIGIPWKVAFALQADGYWLRSEIIWHKPNCLPESVADRPTKSHEQIFLLSKSQSYYYDAAAIMEQASADTHARYARGRSSTHKYADGGPGNQTITRSFEHMRKPGVTPKAAPAGSGIRNNDSFSAAVKDVVEFRNKRSVWTVPVYAFSDAHFSTFPPALILPCVLAGCPEGGTILDPFAGAGTTGLVAKQNGRKFIGIELNPEYVKMAEKRLAQEVLDFDSLSSPTPSELP